MSFNDKYLGNETKKIIAVAYDDTITLYAPYPEQADLNPKAKKYLDKLHEKGYTLVLWSARDGKDYDEAYNRCINEFGLTYLEKDSKVFKHGATGKLAAHFYIDDRCILGKLNWKKVYKFIIKNV